MILRLMLASLYVAPMSVTVTFLSCRALSEGIQSIVLRADTPITDRRRLSILLNRTHDYRWDVDSNGQA